MPLQHTQGWVRQVEGTVASLVKSKNWRPCVRWFGGFLGHKLMHYVAVETCCVRNMCFGRCQMPGGRIPGSTVGLVWYVVCTFVCLRALVHLHGSGCVSWWWRHPISLAKTMLLECTCLLRGSIVVGRVNHLTNTNPRNQHGAGLHLQQLWCSSS